MDQMDGKERTVERLSLRECSLSGLNADLNGMRESTDFRPCMTRIFFNRVSFSSSCMAARWSIHSARVCGGNGESGARWWTRFLILLNWSRSLASLDFHVLDWLCDNDVDGGLVAPKKVGSGFERESAGMCCQLILRDFPFCLAPWLCPGIYLLGTQELDKL